MPEERPQAYRGLTSTTGKATSLRKKNWKATTKPSHMIPKAAIQYHQAYGTETLKTAYTYDVNDQVTLMEDYENNCLDQLTESVCGNISKTYEYDLNGNQISETSREQGTEKAQQLFDYDEEVPDFTTTTRDTTIRRTPDSCRRIHTGETLPSRIHFICMRTARTILSTMLILQGI